MADHIDQTPPTEAIKAEIEEGTRVDVEIQESNGQDLSWLQGHRSINQFFDEKFGSLSTKSTTIFKVNVGLRESNPAAYIPKLLSIGPYHNKNPKYCSMEKYKILYLQRFLNRKEGIIDAESCIRQLENLKGKALMCYDNIENLDGDIFDKFSLMMLLDGCFLVEFIRERFGIWTKGEHCQPIIDNAWMIDQVCRDVVVLENQLPFFVLTMLHDMTKCPNEESFLFMVSCTLLLVVSPKATYIPKSEIDRLNEEQFDHLLHVVHMLSCPLERINSRQRTDASKKKVFCNINIFFGEILRIMKRSNEIPDNPIWRWGNIPSATELYEAGVSFKKIGSVEADPTDTTTLLDIKLENGLLGIPCFVIDDATDTVLRNLIAYEQHSYNVIHYFSNYAHIMYYLINSPKDVRLLRKSGIILNYLGDDKTVANIFDKRGDGVTANTANFSYQEEYSKILQHCQDPSTKMKAYWRKWMKSLRDNYFFTPWAGASTLGAIILLILTTIQTVLAFKGGVK